jgi:hypothetical protein
MSSTSLASLSSAISNRLKLILSLTPRRNEVARLEERGEEEQAEEERPLALLAPVDRGEQWAGAASVAVRLGVVRLAARNDQASDRRVEWEVEAQRDDPVCEVVNDPASARASARVNGPGNAPVCVPGNAPVWVRACVVWAE